jgi:hypothetical protein
MIITLCNNCGFRRDGRQQDACPECDASIHRQTWARLDDPPETTAPETTAPENQPDKRTKLIEQYEALSRERSVEQSKKFSDQALLNYLENKMAGIEAEFQRSGEDIRTYLP